MLFPPFPGPRIVGRLHLLSFPFHQHSIPILLLLAKNNRNETNLDRPHHDVEISSYGPFEEHLSEFFVCKLMLSIHSKPDNRTTWRFATDWVTRDRMSNKKFWPVWTDFLCMMLCLILNILQRRANDPQLLSYFIIFSRFSVFYFQALDQHWILFWSQNSFLLMSAYLIGCFKIFSNDQVRWLASAKYARNEPSVGSKLRSLETSFAKTNQMSNRDDSKRWSDGLFLWTNNFEE